MFRVLVRVAVALGLTCGALVVSWVLPLAHAPVLAQDVCGKIIPSGAVEGATYGDASGGTYEVKGGLVAPGAIAAGGATLAAATVGTGGTALIAAAAVLSVGTAACAWMDWLNRDGEPMGLSQPLSGVASVSTDVGIQSCAAFRPDLTGSWLTRQCIRLELDGGTPVPNATIFRRGDGPVTWSLGGNNFPARASEVLYQNASQDIGWPFPQTAGATVCQHTASTGGACFSWGDTDSIVLLLNASVDRGCMSSLTPIGGVGGACGLHPNAYLVGYPVGGSLATYVIPINPTARELGWSRQLHTHVQCRVRATGAIRWVGEVSAVYYDRSTSARPKIPLCAAGEIAALTRIQRVPTGVTCTVGTICYGNDNVIYQVTMPSELLSTATAPDWSVCLEAGQDCGAPALNSGVCVWGGFNVPADFCDATTQAGNPATNPQASPVSTGTVVPAPYAPGTPAQTSTQPAPSPGGGGTGTVTVPIDPGDGQRPPGGYDEDDTADCWPNGWGWLNPAEWVLKPVKCALVWAFVPDSDAIGDAFASFRDELFAQFPFSLIAGAAGFLGELGDEVESAGGSGCWSWSSWSFGDYATVAGDDVCVGGLSIGSSDRQRIFVIMLAPMVWALMRHAWGMILGGSRREAAT